MKTSSTIPIKSPSIFPDVAVIGAGPVGCVTALAFAHNGAKVLLLEAQPQNTKRLAGEWLHPPGVEILQHLSIKLDINSSEYFSGQGFVVFPDDGSEPIKLSYPDGAVAISCEHNKLVFALRKVAASHPNIQFLGGAKVIHIEGQKLTFEHIQQRYNQTITVGQIVGADGRSSFTRKALGIANNQILISYMAGVLLEDVELPFEGFGHVFLGGPGPALMYRIGTNQIRICLDVPIHSQKKVAYLWDAYSSVFPKVLLPAFRQALQNNLVVWVANQFSSRTHYGRPGLSLVGDATGHFHPMTATGMTMGFLDGECLVRSRNFATYQRQRKLGTYVPEMLATTLHEAFSRDDDSAVAIRKAIYQMWRQNPSYCVRTMRLLSGAEANLLSFSGSFLKGVMTAMNYVLIDAASNHQWQHGTQVLQSFGQWLKSPATLALSRLR
ncbi:FAD-dependent monooxygenase [Nostoc sp. CENA67]|uniref:squalene monooxygenase n=1 Tax=Amazonocrinis nigriterrae CENA67 TaxID=2794033 RepID=A0A8J7HQP4_9NOST|nr:NAD(P)/FAD-dependent oxidoreductase [Amazonocrinis nigriterrae]MBH8561918.1 FAD-dependent monooxygenase [Amazonocrinis nigriterrae CENA67]